MLLTITKVINVADLIQLNIKYVTLTYVARWSCILSIASIGTFPGHPITRRLSFAVAILITSKTVVSNWTDCDKVKKTRCVIFTLY